MISGKLKSRLERTLDLPAMPFIISELLKALDNPDIRASRLAELIEKDQSLTAKVLKVANSPFYGFSREIATVELAIVIMGLNSIKEIVISLIVKKLFSRDIAHLQVKEFWEYSLFCGAAARHIARKIGYSLSGEAFVAGLVHDIGILVIAKFLPSEATQIWNVAKDKNLSITEAEKYVLGDTHSEIGAWIADRWRLPKRISEAISVHHTPFDKSGDRSDSVSPLASIVSLSEWFSFQMDFAKWHVNLPEPSFYLKGDILSSLAEDTNMTNRGLLESLKQEILTEFERAKAFNSISAGSSLYKKRTA
jgi:HD-like signal output (HDOD) protein